MKFRINLKNLTVQVVIAIILGILLGHFFPATGEKIESPRRYLYQND